MKTFLGVFLKSFSFVFAYRKYQSKTHDPMDMTVFEFDKYNFDKELDFELMGIETLMPMKQGAYPRYLGKIEKT